MEQAAEQQPIRLPCGCIVGPQPHYCPLANVLKIQRDLALRQAQEATSVRMRQSLHLGAHRAQVELSWHRLTDAPVPQRQMVLRREVPVRDPVTWRDRL